MDLEEAVTVAGIGCRKGVSRAEVLAAVDAALRTHGLSRSDLEVIAALDQKQAEPGIVETAAVLGLPLVAVCAESEEVREGLITHSQASLAATGFGSAAEAAALAAAGPGAQLFGPRLATGVVTCAIAANGGRP